MNKAYQLLKEYHSTFDFEGFVKSYDWDTSYLDDFVDDANQFITSDWAYDHEEMAISDIMEELGLDYYENEEERYALMDESMDILHMMFIEYVNENPYE